jgi:hypothetical protein
MVHSNDKYWGTAHSTTVALLLAAFSVIPVVLFESWAPRYTSIIAALAFSVVCANLAQAQWKKYSELTILSREAQRTRVK